MRANQVECSWSPVGIMDAIDVTVYRTVDKGSFFVIVGRGFVVVVTFGVVMGRMREEEDVANKHSEERSAENSEAACEIGTCESRRWRC